MRVLGKAKKVFELEIEELRRLQSRLGSEFVNVVESLRDVAERGGKIVVIGVGKNSYIGEKIAATLTSTGSPAISLNSLNALHGDLGIVGDGDVVLALSYSGETEEILNLVGALRRFNVKIVALSGRSESTLAHQSDLFIDIEVKKEACPLELAPTSSTTAMLVLGDAIAMVLLEMRGFRREDFAKFHPAGNLGLQLRTKAVDMMRTTEQTVIVSQDDPISSVLERWATCKVGAAIVIDETKKKLRGIFTHGDFVRAFKDRGGEVSDLKVRELMTPNPISTHVDALAMEVVAIFNEHRIDEVVVLDTGGQPVGLIDVQDLTRMKLL